jgi:hypothetical protein
MSGAEMLAHAQLMVHRRRWRSRKDWRAPTPHAIPAHDGNLPTTLSREKNAVIAEAERYLRGDYCLLNLPFHESPMDWHRDPQTGRRAPLEFALDINYLDTALVGNIKFLWEKNRHHHLTVLALAYRLSGDERFANEVTRQLLGWLEQNPFPRGVNWSSSLELGVRLISWSWIDRLLRGGAAHAQLFGPAGALWPAIYWHQWMIERHQSRGSSANNHLVGEMAGLFIAATEWPVFDESARWREHARKTLEHEILAQTFPCGLNREMAFAYHLFTRDLFHLAGDNFSDQYRQRLARMFAVIPAMTDSGGNLPRFGDSDDGMVLPLSLPPVAAGSTNLDEAGMFVLKSEQLFVLADAGPLGFGPTAAHGHADALSFTLSAGGKPLLIDPGTYDYLMEARWRAYFRGTRAHNTVVVDGLDQSIQAGPFLWIRHAHATVHHRDQNTLTASHDGYGRIGVTHRRRFSLDGNALALEDSLTGRGTHSIELCFHAAPQCDVQQLSPHVVSIANARLTLPERTEVTLVRGGEDAGWYSPHYGVKEPTWSIFARARCALPATFKTIVEVVR